MAMMAFKAGSFGYGGVSAGGIFIVTTIGGGYTVHHWAGSGSSSVFAGVWSQPFEVPHNGILSNFSGQDVRLKIGGGIIGWGRTSFKFSIRYSRGSRAEAYNVAPSAPDNELGVSVRGPIMADIEVFGNFNLVTSGEFRSRTIYELFDVLVT